MPRRNPLKFIIDAIDSLREALQILPVSRAVSSRDKRSEKRSKKLVKELEQYKPSEVAGQLQISTQKYVAIRRQVEEGKVSSKALNDLLEGATETLQTGTQETKKIATYPHEEEDEYITEAPVRGKRKFKIDYAIADEEFVKQKMKWATPIKRGMSRQSALNWFGNVAGGKEYFWIVKDKKGRYSIYDIRTARERNRAHKGQVSGQTKAAAIYDQYSQEWEEKFAKPKEKKHGKKSKSKSGPGKSKTKKHTSRGGPKKGRPVETRKSKKVARS